MRKASAHGLGDKRAPYDDDRAPTSIPNPIVKLPDIGVDRWQYDLWYQIIKAALAKQLLIPEEAAPQFLDDAAPRNGMMPPPDSEMIARPITE